MNYFKAIITEYTPATNTRGSRYVATDTDRNRVSLKVEPEWNEHQGHEAAVRALCKKLDWRGRLILGAITNFRPHRNVRVWVWKSTKIASTDPSRAALTTYASEIVVD